MATLIDSGELRLIFQHRLVVSPESRAAAEAVECAGEQGKFWVYHDLLYKNTRLPSGFTKSNLTKFAADTGLDTKQFTACLDSRKYQQRVEEQNQAAAKLGVRATPTFSINGKLVEGLPPGDGLKQMILQELKK